MPVVKCCVCQAPIVRSNFRLKYRPKSVCSKKCLIQLNQDKWFKVREKLNCINCGKELTLTQYRARRKKSKNIFCSRSCAAVYNNRMFPKRKSSISKCVECQKEIPGNQKYCSHSCQVKYRQQKYITEWKAGLKNGPMPIPRILRNYLIKEAGYKCQQCGFNKPNPSSNKSVLQVNHKDGNAFNQTPGNHEVLCPNCHAMTPTWGGLNHGKGRKTLHNLIKTKTN